MTARPRVVVVAEAAPMRGGIATFAETITADPGLRAEFDVELLNTARSATREGGRVSLENARAALVDAWRTYRAARHADVVHLQLVADPGAPSLRAAALLLAGSAGRARLVAHVHSAVGNAGRPEHAAYGRLDRWALSALRRAQLVCTVSDVGTARMRQLAGRTPVVTVDNAVAVDTFVPTRPDRVPATVLFVGVVCRRKGTLELARACRALRERGVEGWRLVVVGGQGPTPEPEYREIVEEFAAAGLAESLVGPEHGEQVKRRLQEADVFVLPSYLEGQPIAIIEAMATGVPVVGTTIGAVPDLIRDGVDGLVVEPGDVDALSAALESLVTDPGRRVAMGASVRRRAEERHDLTQLSARLAGLYRQVLEDGPRPVGAGTGAAA
ncbi:glycosyltransferase family 4 protein [Microlunatus capsulatus]|uniref:Glycosyltransferase involved in cell wall biosynthesis n=1 Tax=Microlunatus capsulatus TaxID=99117 RepID=A0ABS4Z4E3_9ACTN|nr:glycosyltransferase family 4 protein [Microlunatus capsulatus]MBP2415922.1 glycosyltransferase involved in cell wall biosynthesis [Microlunatus capsulatus]